MMLYGKELIESLEKEIESLQKSISDRYDRIDKGWTDMDDCFVSQKCEDRGITNNRQKIKLIEDGGCAWFVEYANLDGELVDANWIKTQYGYRLKAILPNGEVVWTSAHTAKGLAKKGLKKVKCLRPAWYRFYSPHGGLLGAYTGDYRLFPSDVNYATGEPAPVEPIEIKDVEEDN